MYIPYIASHILDQHDSTYFDMKGARIDEPSIATTNVITLALTVSFVNKFEVQRNAWPEQILTYRSLGDRERTVEPQRYFHGRNQPNRRILRLQCSL